VDTDREDTRVNLATAAERCRQLTRHLAARRDVIVADTVATFPLSKDARRLDAGYCVRLGNQVVDLICEAVNDGQLDWRGAGISELAAMAAERDVSPEQLFMFVRIVTGTAINELSQDDQVGARTEGWPQTAPLVRRAAFELLAAWTTRSIQMPARASIEDSLTTLHTRPVLDAVLPKECSRAERFEHWLSMMLIDIDDLSGINQSHGYGVGDRILERTGILLRTYFRQHDWVVRYAADTIAVLLPETTPEDALLLADRTRSMIEDRLTFRDYRTDQRAAVTVSVAVTSARALEGEPIDHEVFQANAEAALERAKVGGRNRVEQVELLPRLISLEDASAQLGTTLHNIESMVADGTLEPVKSGRHVRLDRAVVEALARAGRG